MSADISEKFHKICGIRLRKARKGNGLTQETLAEKCGVSNRLISSIEAGSRSLTENMAKKLGKALHVKPGWLMGESDDNGTVKAFERIPVESNSILEGICNLICDNSKTFSISRFVDAADPDQETWLIHDISEQSSYQTDKKTIEALARFTLEYAEMLIENHVIPKSAKSLTNIPKDSGGFFQFPFDYEDLEEDPEE